MFSSTIDKFFKSDFGFLEDISEAGDKVEKDGPLQNEKGD